VAYTALLLDFGGVLTTPMVDSWLAFCAREGIDVEAFVNVVVGGVSDPNSMFAAVEIGRIELVEFERHLAGLLSEASGRAIHPENLKDRLMASLKPDERMLDAVRAARAAGCATALLSNSWGPNGYPRAQLDDLFDAVVISAEVGMRKPDLEIYLATARALGRAPQECVFVDDFEGNVRGADAAGMRGVLHHDTAETIPALASLLGLSLE